MDGQVPAELSAFLADLRLQFDERPEVQEALRVGFDPGGVMDLSTEAGWELLEAALLGLWSLPAGRAVLERLADRAGPAAGVGES